MNRSDIKKNQKRKEVNKIEEYKGIKRLLEKGNIELATLALEEYLEKYPRESFGIREYATILRHQGTPEKALSILEQSEEIKVQTLREKGYYYIYMEDYESALEELNKIALPTASEKNAKLLCLAKMGKLQKTHLEYYAAKQMVDYSVERAIEHIKGHKDTERESFFSEDIDIEELYQNVRSLLPNAIQTINGDLMKKYIFHIPGIGYTNQNIKLNHLSVTVLPNSYDILTMCPDTYKRNTEINDYESMLSMQDDKKEPTKVKVIKRESQIDKFNRRYGKK